MSRARVALLLAVLTAAAGALAYGLLVRSPATHRADPSLQPLVVRAALEPCTGEVASRAGAAGVLPVLRLPCLDGTGPRDLLWTGARTQPPTIVNVYGSWCGPCATEMPLLRQLHRAAGSKLRLVGVDTEDGRRNGLLFAIDLGQRWSALFDDDGLVSRALGGGAPKTVFISTAGKVVHVQRGSYSSYPALVRDVRRYLGVAL
jgi:thiol-disulfide isomerase/thioredoxin